LDDGFVTQCSILPWPSGRRGTLGRALDGWDFKDFVIPMQRRNPAACKRRGKFGLGRTIAPMR
jgi:hypothetical protein